MTSLWTTVEQPHLSLMRIRAIALIANLYTAQARPLRDLKAEFFSVTSSMLLDVHAVGNHALSGDHPVAPRIWPLLMLKFDMTST